MPLDIPAHDHGKLYIFDISEADATKPVAELLGTQVNRDFVDMVTLADLPENGGLAWYLQEGYGIAPTPEETIALASIPTHALVVMSRAFDGAEQSLHPIGRHAITLTAPQPEATVPLAAATDGTLDPALGGAAPERSSRIWIYALVTIFGIFAFMAWRIASGNV